MSAVYEKARAQGYSKARAAKIGWGALKRAGYDISISPRYKHTYASLRHLRPKKQPTVSLPATMFDPDHFDYEVSMLKEIINQLKAKDEYLDMQAERLGTRYHPQILTPHVRRAVSIGRSAYGRGRSTLTRIRPQRTALPRRPPPTIRASPKAMKTGRPSYISDPAKLVEPHDYPGYDNLNNVRYVARDDTEGYYPTRGLVEGQVVLPQNQFLKNLDEIEQNDEFSHAELLDEDGDGFIDRIVFRGPKDATRPKARNVGLFIDIAKPLRTDRLAVENWSLTE